MRQTLNAPLSSIFPVLPRWAALPPPILKDLRVAAAPAVWGIAILILGEQFFKLGNSGLSIHSIACSAIASMVFGHDFLYRTAPWNMALPISRSRVWLQRMLIAALAMLPVLIAGFAMEWLRLLDIRDYLPPVSWRSFAFQLFEPAITALCLAPWLTLISRSALFGTVFSLGAMFIAYIVASTILQILGFADPEKAAATFMSYAMPCLWIAGLVMGWRKFLSLELIEGSSLKATKSTHVGQAQRIHRSSPTWQLLKKEVMIQRFPIALSILAMALACLLNKDHVALWTLVYPVALIIVMGSVSSADERQMGTVEWQVLLPVAYWKQWLAKLSITFATALVFALMLPIWIWSWKTGALRKELGADIVQIAPLFIAAIFTIVAITQYVSSFCNSALRAIMASVLVNWFAAFMLMQSFLAYTNLLWKHGNIDEKGNFIFQNGEIMRSPESSDWWTHAEFTPFLISIFGAIALSIVFAARNHRYADGGAARILRQVAGFAAYELVAIALISIYWQ